MDDALKALRASWYAEARKQTLKRLPAFLEKLAGHKHDYNTICYACGAAAVAATWAIERSPSGGITGFQAGAIMWEFITEWMGEQDKPLRLVKYENMLYPQYEREFDKIISQETADWLKAEAQKRLNDRADDGAHPAVVAHWRSITAGNLPFGYRVGE
jgi:hypothetical protein